MRPQAMAFTTLPCQLEHISSFYGSELKDRARNAESRYKWIASQIRWCTGSLKSNLQISRREDPQGHAATQGSATHLHDRP